MRVSPVVKSGTSWYRDLIARLNPTVAALPSTNDQPEHIPMEAVPGQLRGRVVRRQAEKICADPVVLAMFHPKAQNHLREGRALGATGVQMETIQWGEALASWRARYRDRLVDEGSEAQAFSGNSQPLTGTCGARPVDLAHRRPVTSTGLPGLQGGVHMQSNNPIFRRSEEFNQTSNASGNQMYAGAGGTTVGFGDAPVGTPTHVVGPDDHRLGRAEDRDLARRS